LITDKNFSVYRKAVLCVDIAKFEALSNDLKLSVIEQDELAVSFMEIPEPELLLYCRKHNITLGMRSHKALKLAEFALQNFAHMDLTSIAENDMVLDIVLHSLKSHSLNYDPEKIEAQELYLLLAKLSQIVVNLTKEQYEFLFKTFDIE